MNLPNIKEIVGKLSVFKNNKALLVPVIIVFVAAILFIPTTLISRSLRKRMNEESIREGASVITRRPRTQGLASERQRREAGAVRNQRPRRPQTRQRWAGSRWEDGTTERGPGASKISTFSTRSAGVSSVEVPDGSRATDSLTAGCEVAEG